MKIYIKVFLFTLILLPHFSFAASFKMTSPEKGETYYFGEDLDIEWKPARKGVKTLILESKNTKDALTIYAQKVFGYPVNYTGQFTYEIPKYLIVRPGEYYIKAILEDDSVYKSEVFNLISQDSNITADIKQTDKIKYAFGKVIGIQKEYETVDNIEFSIEAFESSGIIANPQNGFNIQAHIFKKGKRNPATQAVNASYDYNLKTWNVSFKEIERTGAYEIVVSLYCGNINTSSYCANKYGSRDQVEKVLPIKIIKEKKNTAEKITQKEHFLSGDINSPVKVVTYSDLECPFCKSFHQTTKKLIDTYGNKVAFIYRHFPLTQIHPRAEIAANATECVSKLGGEDKFSKYVDRVFEISPNLDTSILVDIAGEVGLSEKDVQACLSKKRYSKEVRNDIKLGTKLLNKDNSFGVPYSVVSGYGKEELIKGALPFESAKDVIDNIMNLR